MEANPNRTRARSPRRWTSQFTTELLELFWVLEATVDGYPKQAKLLEAVIESDCFQTDELPPVPEKDAQAAGGK